jgi:hypothetical protein
MVVAHEVCLPGSYIGASSPSLASRYSLYSLQSVHTIQVLVSLSFGLSSPVIDEVLYGGVQAADSMTIFSKKRGESHPVLSSPTAQSTLIPDQLPGGQGASAVSLHPGWDAVPQRPRTSDGPPQYQSALGQDYLTPPTIRKHKKTSHSLSKLNLSSMTNLLSSSVPDNPDAQAFNDTAPAYEQEEVQSLYDMISAKFNTIVTLIDGEKFSGNEAHLTLPQNLPLWQQEESAYTEREISKKGLKVVKNRPNFTLEFSSGNYFSKVHLYANSQLPRHLPPMKLYVQLQISSIFSNMSQISCYISSTVSCSTIFRTSLRETIGTGEGGTCGG